MDIVGSVLYSSTQGVSGTEDDWLFMSQEPYDSTRQSANFTDIDDMFQRAKGGLSARSRKKPGCGVATTSEAGDEEGVTIVEVTMSLPFYVFVPSDEFVYHLESNHPDITTISDEYTVEAVQRSGTIVVPMEDQIDFEAIVTDVSLSTETPVYNERGEVIPLPTEDERVIDGRYLRFPEPLFAALWAKYRVIGHRYIFTLTITHEEGFSVSNITPVVVAHWVIGGETKSKTLTLTIPDCVYTELEACPDGQTTTYYAINADDAKPVAVYYSSCDGKWVATVEGVDEESET